MRNFLNRISREVNCVCVSIILGYVCLKQKNPSFLRWFGQVVFQEAPSGPKTFALNRRQLQTKSCGKEFCWDLPFKRRQLVLSEERSGTDDHELPYGKLQAGNWTKQK